jgi:hypothetical protein
MYQQAEADLAERELYFDIRNATLPIRPINRR